MSLALRTTVTDPLILGNSVRAAIQTVEPNQPVFLVKTMRQLVDESLAQRRFALLLMSIFAAVALLLAAVGIYGVMSYTVSRRRPEIGLRMALVAQAGDVLTLMLKQGMALALMGLSVGLLAALALTRLMQTVLFEVGAIDPLTFSVFALTLLFVALLACWIPARRATKVDPMIALRCE
jgi:putative ABC transport system permease protein